jgi:hypothetical protein
MLYADLLRQSDGTVQFQKDVNISLSKIGPIEVPILAVRNDGTQYAIALSGPLTNDFPADSLMTELQTQPISAQLVLVNELLVRGNLPAATREVQQRLSA